MKILDVPQSGSYAGVTSSRNRYGQYKRTRARPVNPNTVKQTAVRNTMTAISQQWKTLNGPQQASWKSYANAHPVLDRLGSSIILSPNAMFMKVNVPASLAGLDVLLAAPPNVPGPVPPPFTISVTYVVATPAFNFDFSPTPMPANITIQVYAGAPQSPGVSFDKNLRLVGQINPADVAPSDFRSPYVATWGAPTVGQKIFIRYDEFHHSVKINSWTDVITVA